MHEAIAQMQNDTARCQSDLLQSAVVNEMGGKLIEQRLVEQDKMLQEVRKQVDRAVDRDQKNRQLDPNRNMPKQASK